MAEAIGLAASLVGLIQLAGQLTCISYGYIGAVRRAPSDLRDLVDELHSLGKILTSLQEYVDANPTSSALQKLNDTDGPIKGCIKELDELRPKLEPRGGFRGFVKGLKWPLKEADTMAIVARVERHKTLFVFALTADQIALSKKIEAYVEETNKAVKNESQAQDAWRQKEDAQAKEQRRKGILDWLYNEDFNTKHVEISNRRQDATGGWLVRAPEFLKWIKDQPDFRLLWGCGIPGAGKTFLSSVMIDYFKGQARAENYGVAHIYFDYKEQDRQKPAHVLASLTKQLLIASSSPDLPPPIYDLHGTTTYEGRPPTLEELYTVLIAASKPFNRVFLILDALDECNAEKQRKQLLPLLKRMAKDGISLFVTSRPHPEDIMDALSGPEAAKMELAAREEDIAAYIEQRIEENSRARRLVKQGKCKDRIISELAECSKGMFLLVRFHIEFLCQQTSARQILKSLETLRTTSSGEKQLYPTYDRVIDTIRNQEDSSSELAFKALSWLVKARRTLTTQELLIAVSIEEELYELDDMDLPDSAILLDVCAGLVIIDEMSGTVRLAHHTVQEYLIHNSVIFSDTEFRISVACITYLSFDALEGGPCATDEMFKDRLVELPFLDYAAHLLPAHLSTAEEELPVDMVLKFSESPGHVASYLQASHIVSYFPRDVLALHIIASFGHLEATQQLLDDGADITSVDQHGLTPLYYAAGQRRSPVVQLLLENGADVNVACNNGDTPLHAAATGGHVGNGQILLDKGADIAAVGEGGQALHRASGLGHVNFVRMLLDNGADITARDPGGETPLHRAAARGHEAVVALLISRGAEVAPSQVQDEDPPLQRAVGAGHEGIVKTLLKAGASPRVCEGRGRSALSVAVMSGSEGIARALLEAGADVEAPDIYGETPMHKAALNGNMPLVELLLDFKAEISAKTKHDWTPLHLACMTDNVRLLRFLLDKGANILDRCDYGQSPLHWAFSGVYEDTVRFLLGEGVDLTAVSGVGRTALHYAVHHGTESIFRLLLDNGFTGPLLSIQDSRGETALHEAAGKGYEAAVRMLLDEGAEIGLVQEDGKTALFKAAEEGHEAVARMLLDKGADITTVATSGQTALEVAREKKHDAVVKLLEDAGARAVGGSP